MAQTWTDLKFCQKKYVEAVPTTWFVGSDHCYQPPVPQKCMILKTPVGHFIRKRFVVNRSKREIKQKKSTWILTATSKNKVRYEKVLSSDEESELSSWD
ncbi:hypothetical protein JTB14_007977 [Gonioctena quinquepunctata]|nr:hypothetical protein JTB14_007977 [Gonioctena quinquepunctata]